MSEDTRTGPTTGSEWDHVAVALQEWRRRAGNPSFTEIAARITRARVASGTPPAAARVGRTTVYDAFRLGRKRISFALVREIGVALEADRGAIQELLAMPAGEPRPTPPADPVVDGSPPPDRFAAWRPGLVLMAACVAANLVGREFVDLLNLPVYLDMAGTALAAIVLGPWRGAAVGASTNLLGFFTTGIASVPFGLVNVAGALLWGYGVQRYGMGRTLSRFFALTLLVALVCSLLAVPMLYFVYGGSIGHGQDTLTDTLVGLTHEFGLALTLGNLLTSAADKVISAFAALVVASVLGIGIAGITPHPGSHAAERS